MFVFEKGEATSLRENKQNPLRALLSSLRVEILRNTSNFRARALVNLLLKRKEYVGSL